MSKRGSLSAVILKGTDNMDIPHGSNTILSSPFAHFWRTPAFVFLLSSWTDDDQLTATRISTT